MKLKTIAISLTSIIALSILIMITVIWYIATPTKGNKIADYTNPCKALMIIDVQEDYTGKTAKPPFPYKESQEVISTINQMILQAKDNGIKVIYVKQEFGSLLGKSISTIFSKGTAIKGNPGTEIDSRISLISPAHIFEKSIGDAFSNQKLNKFLVDNSINELYLVGLDAEYCVHKTAQGAINRGYKVIMVTDALLLLAQNKWDRLLKLYSKEGFELTKSSEFLSRLNNLESSNN